MPRKTTPDIDARLRAALIARLETVSLRDIATAIGPDKDGKTIVSFSTLGDYARGYPSGRPQYTTHLYVHQAEHLATYLGMRLRLDQ